MCVGLEPPCQQEQVWEGGPGMPVTHLRGRLCAACALSVPTPHRDGGGEGGERGLKGINHGRKKRAGGRGTAGAGRMPTCYPLLLCLLDEQRCDGERAPLFPPQSENKGLVPEARGVLPLFGLQVSLAGRGGQQ